MPSVFPYVSSLEEVAYVPVQGLDDLWDLGIIKWGNVGTYYSTSYTGYANKKNAFIGAIFRNKKDFGHNCKSLALDLLAEIDQ